MIFTILVSFSWDNALFASKAKINFFEKNFERSEKNIQKTLILAYEVIVQPPKTYFLTFLCETKIVKITHSANTMLCVIHTPHIWHGVSIRDVIVQ